MRRLARFGLPALAVLLAGAGPFPGARRALPPIVFVSRLPAADLGAIPGFGPRHRALAPGGRLLRREPDGVVRELLPPGALHDVSDPAVSFDARWIAFAGTPHPDSGWRLYRVPATGGAPIPVTRTDRAGRFDDLDPCWIGARTLCFASTRGAASSQYGALPVTNLHVVEARGGAPVRLTFERDGAEEPAYDPVRDRIVYARWWYGHRRAALDPAIATAARHAVHDSVNGWQLVEITPRGDELRLAAGAPGSRAGTMAYQPARLADGDWCAVYARNAALVPAPGGAGIRRFRGRYRAGERLAGPLPAGDGHDPYSASRGLAAPSAVAPAGLARGGMLAAYDAGARGDFGIVTIDARGAIATVVDLPGRLELDPAPVEPRPARASRLRDAPGPAATLAPGDPPGTFTYDCADVRARDSRGARVFPDAPRSSDLTMRFFAVGVRPGAADTALLIREAPVGHDGSVRVAGLPAATPMFEQLVDAGGRVLRTAHGPTQVAGTNWAPAGSTARCTGCHLGHSALDVERRGYGRATDPR